MLGESIVNDRNDRNDESGVLEGMLELPYWESASASLGIGELSSKRAGKDDVAFSFPSTVA